MSTPTPLKLIRLTAGLDSDEFSSSANLDLVLPNGRPLRIIVNFNTNQDEIDIEADDPADLHIDVVRDQLVVGSVRLTEPQPTPGA